ncbi:MAG: nitroreductase family protein [Anaerolineae bacterium]|nr:nitroreductase family protein [Anaerolineae bacterium]
MLKELVTKCRSYRRFHQDAPVSEATLRELVDLARLSASGANRQPLKYMLSADPLRNALIFPSLGWAGYLRDWPGPAEGERPSAYVIVLHDKGVAPSFGCDHGIASQSILLGAVDKGLGGCIIASVKREELRSVLAIPERYDIIHVIALGKPKEQVMIEEMLPDGDFKYWRDADGVHHVPKYRLDDIIVG